MKKIIFLICIFIFFSVGYAESWEIDMKIVEAGYRWENPKSSIGYRLDLSHKRYYLSGQTEIFNIYGQDIRIDSLSIGYKYPFKNIPISVYGQVGYYFPVYDANNFGREAIYNEQSKQYNYPGIESGMPWSDHYQLNFKPSYGAEFGVEFVKNISKNISINIGAAYRYLRMWADYDGLDASGNPYWIMSRSDNFDAIKISAGIRIEF